MRRWLVGTFLLIASLYAIGWVLVVVSGHGGNRVGGSVVLWRFGGIVVYVAVASTPVWVLGAVIALGVKRLVSPRT